jgi:hypothetical protein
MAGASNKNCLSFSSNKDLKLKKHGFKETKASIANKLVRESLPAAFFLACLAAMELEGVVLEEI